MPREAALSKFGGFTAFSAEAALWVAGAALIAGAVGAHWSMPNVDVAGLVAASTSPGASVSHAPTSPTPKAKPTPSPSPLPPLDAYLKLVVRSDFQFEATSKETVSFNGKAVISGTESGIESAHGDDCSSVQNYTGGSYAKLQVVMIGSDEYKKTDNAAWTKTARGNLTCDPIFLLRYTGLADKGTDTKNGVKTHRLEVSDAVQYSSYYEKHVEGLAGTLAQSTLKIWVKDDGTPVAVETVLSYTPTVNGVARPTVINTSYAFTKFSGVTITAPIK